MKVEIKYTYRLEEALRLWKQGYTSFEKRQKQNPTDVNINDVVGIMTNNLTKLMKANNIRLLQDLANLYAVDGLFIMLWGSDETYQYYLNLDSGYFPSNYVMASTFEDAAFYLMHLKIIEGAF